MLATELITKLQDAVDKHGDAQVMIEDSTLIESLIYAEVDTLYIKERFYLLS